MILTKESVVKDLIDNSLCRWCAEKENLKAQADPNCCKCKGEGYTIYIDHHTYPVPHDYEVQCNCDCIKKVKEVLSGQSDRRGEV
jgi:hypothetical protein